MRTPSSAVAAAAAAVYSEGPLQQAHSTTAHEAPHTVGSALAPPPPPSAVNPSTVPSVPPVQCVPPQVGLQLALPLNAPDPNNHHLSSKPEPSEVQ